VRQEKPLKPRKQSHRLFTLFRNCLLGYRWFFSTLGKVALFLITLLFALGLIVIPLWYLSTTYPTFYGILVEAMLGTSILIPLCLRILKAFKNTSRGELQRELWRRVRKTGFVVMEVLLLLAAFRSYHRGYGEIAIGISFLFFLTLGLGFYRYHEKQR
jgi:hypothetical protein